MSTNPTNLHPMNNRIMVALDQQKEEIIGGIIIPEKAKQVPSEGVVIELGAQNIDISSGRKIPWSVQVGQRLLIQKFAGYTQKVDGTEYQFILEGDVIAVIGEAVSKVEIEASVSSDKPSAAYPHKR